MTAYGSGRVHVLAFCGPGYSLAGIGKQWQWMAGINSQWLLLAAEGLHSRPIAGCDRYW